MEQENTKNKKSRKKTLFLFGVFFLLGALFFVLWQYLSGPAIGTIQEGLLPSDEDLFETRNERKRYDGKYLSFSYPALFVSKTDTAPVNGPVKESIFLTETGFQSRKITVILEEREENNLEASPSFKMRLEKPKIYKKKLFSEGAFDGSLFEQDTPVFEQTAFFRDGKSILSVSVTSPTTLEGLEEELRRVVRSIRKR